MIALSFEPAVRLILGGFEGMGDHGAMLLHGSSPKPLGGGLTMARTRNLKPGFFKNVKLAKLGPLSQLLFAGLWTIADREGRLEDEPQRIKVEVLPYHKCNVNGLLDGLAECGFITRYSSGLTSYIAIPTWKKHQNPHLKEPPSTIPAPEIPVLAPDLHQTRTVQEQFEPSNFRNEPGLNPSSLTLNPSPNHPSTVQAPDDFPEWAEGIYARWQKRKDKPLALEALGRMQANGLDRPTFEKRFLEWANYETANGWQYAPTLATWLHDESYKYPPPPIDNGHHKSAGVEETKEQYHKRMGWK